jgi:hypothetical protein
LTLQDLGSLGELIGGIAVVASLIYLALQIRQNTRSTHASMAQSVYSRDALRVPSDRLFARRSIDE